MFRMPGGERTVSRHPRIGIMSFKAARKALIPAELRFRPEETPVPLRRQPCLGIVVGNPTAFRERLIERIEFRTSFGRG